MYLMLGQYEVQQRPWEVRRHAGDDEVDTDLFCLGKRQCFPDIKKIKRSLVLIRIDDQVLPFTGEVIQKDRLLHLFRILVQLDKAFDHLVILDHDHEEPSACGIVQIFADLYFVGIVSRNQADCLQAHILRLIYHWLLLLISASLPAGS